MLRVDSELFRNRESVYVFIRFTPGMYSSFFIVLHLYPFYKILKGLIFPNLELHAVNFFFPHDIVFVARKILANRDCIQAVIA